MRITNKDIARDVEFVIGEIKTKEVEIPSLFRCMVPGLLFIPLVLTWHILLLFIYDVETKEPLTPLIAALAACVFILFISSQLRSKYFSLPETVRQNSVIIRLVKRTTFLYSGIWIVFNMCIDLMYRELKMEAVPDTQLILLFSLVIFWMFALLDLGRYDVALLSSAIQTWREGGDLEPLLDKK